MSVNPSPADLHSSPESAPFTAEQRTWLNGFFAGLVCARQRRSGRRCRSADAAALMPRRRGREDDDDAPWHDQTLPLAERMKLAEGGRCAAG